VELNKAKMAIIGLVVLGVAWLYLGNPSSEYIFLIAVGIAGLGGYDLGRARKQKEIGRKTNPEEDPPEFQNKEHTQLWNKIHENSEAIAVLSEDMDWVSKE